MIVSVLWPSAGCRRIPPLRRSLTMELLSEDDLNLRT